MEPEANIETKEIDVLLRTSGLTKAFPGVLAVDCIDFDLLPGEVHGVVGENGAGKSTFCNLLTGVYKPDKGRIFLNGRETKINHPSEAISMGIRMVHQERNLISFLNGIENVCLNSEPTKYGIINEKESKKLVEEVMERFNIKINTSIPISWLNPSDQQMLEIIRAVLHQPRVLILDEPTSSLGDEYVEILKHIIKYFKKAGTGIVYISHKLEEVIEICDRVSVFRDGANVITKNSNEITREQCINYMANRNLTTRYPEVQNHKKDIALLQVANISDNKGKIRNIDFEVYEGEVLGIYGLVGSGRTELAETLFGLRSVKTGEILFGPKSTILTKSTAKYRINQGVILLPEDRVKSGLFPCFDLRGNISIPFVDKISNRFKSVKIKMENSIVNKILNSPLIKLKYSNPKQSVYTLSGGNKQKLLIGRMLEQNAKLVILDEPTKGIDVGTKFDIYTIIREIAREGRGVIFISSELPELIGICDRIIVMKQGQLSGELNRCEFEQEKILSLCF